jgi:ribosomal-protein-alanine N-acetyltransferase
MLLDSLEKLFRDRKACRSILEVRVSNERAISFYEKRGYRINGVIRGYYRDNEDAYVMSKTIC